AVPALLVVEFVAREAHDLIDVEQLALPRELPVPRALPRLVVDPQLDLAVEVVLVLRHALDHPELALRERARGRRPRDAVPPLHHEADRTIVVDRDGAPPTVRQQPALDFARD